MFFIKALNKVKHIPFINRVPGSITLTPVIHGPDTANYMTGNNMKDEKSLLKGYNMLLYFAGSLIIYEPDEECVVDFWSNGILKRLPVRSNNPRFIEAASQLRDSCHDISSCREMLQNDYNRLFGNPGLALAPPVKSYYFDNSDQCKPGVCQVSEFYKSFGWTSRLPDDIPDDNLGIELLFLTLLIDKYISFEDEVCRCEMRKEIKRFISQHIMSWLPEWNNRIREFSLTNCYKGIATLIHASCEDIFAIMDRALPGMNNPDGLRN